MWQRLDRTRYPKGREGFARYLRSTFPVYFGMMVVLSIVVTSCNHLLGLH